MNSLVFVACLAVLSAANASLIGGLGATLVGPANLGATLVGPSAKGTVIGPDGGLVSGAAQAGAVVAGPTGAGLVSAAVSPGLVGIGAPAVLAAPAIAAAPLGLGLGLGLGGLKSDGAILAGPSGTVVRSNGLVGIAGPAAVLGAPAIATTGLGLGIGTLGLGLGGKLL